MSKLPQRSEQGSLFVGLSLLYLLLPTRKYYWDGVSFAQIIEDVPRLHPNLIHPNHLLYNVFGYLIYKAVGLSGIPVRALYVLQFMNCVLGVLCAYVIFLILKSTFGSKYLSYSLTLLFSLSATWWRFATDAGAYIPSILFLLVCFCLILPSREPRPIRVAVIHAISILFHQLAVLFVPVALVGIFYQASSQAKGRKVKLMLHYIAALFSIIVPTYYFCFYLREGRTDLGAFIHWTFSHSADSHFAFNIWKNFIATTLGHLRLFLDTSGRLPWTLSLNNPLMVILFFGLLSAVAILCSKLVRDSNVLSQFVRAIPSNISKSNPLAVLLIVWCACYLAFLFFFLPGNTFYRLFYLPAIILFLGILLNRPMDSSDHKRKHRTVLLVLIVAAFNLIFLIFPYSRVQGNPPLELALKMNRGWPRRTVIYYTELNSDDMIIKYFNPQTTWTRFDTTATAALESDLREAYLNGETVWINTVTIASLTSQPEGKVWLQEHTEEAHKFEFVNRKIRIQYFQIFPVLPESTPNKSLDRSAGSVFLNLID
jgi:hypothetical protein